MIPRVPDRFLLPRLSWPEVAALDGGRTLVVLPVAAVEQHGPHLPVYTDSIIGEALLGRALGSRPDDGRVWALPTLVYGKSNEHGGFPGTFSLTGETLGRMLRELARGVQASGIRRLLLLGSHGGNIEVLDMAARDIRDELDLLCFSAHPFRFGLAAEVISDAEGGLGLHGGEGETSILLAVCPELVNVDAYEPELPRRLSRFTYKGAATVGWLTRDLSRSGTIGDPRGATAEKGEAILDREARLVVELIEEALAFEFDEGSA